MSNTEDEALERINRRMFRVSSEAAKEEGLEGCRPESASLTMKAETVDGESLAFNIWNITFRRDDGSGSDINQQPTTTIKVEARRDKDDEALKAEIAQKLRVAEWRTVEGD
jgi:hypothetical protein